jgi:hypothetical protein
VVLPAFTAGGPALVWAWFAAAWTYGLLAIPVLLLPAALGLQGNPVVKVATYAGAASVLLSLIGFLRWVFVVPSLASTYASGDGQHAGCGGRCLDSAAPVRRRAAGRAPGPAAGDRVVRRTQHRDPAQRDSSRDGSAPPASSPAPSTCSIRATSSPPPSPDSPSGTWPASSAAPVGASGWQRWVSASSSSGQPGAQAPLPPRSSILPISQRHGLRNGHHDPHKDFATKHHPCLAAVDHQLPCTANRRIRRHA